MVQCMTVAQPLGGATQKVSSGKVLVIGDDTRSFLAIVRSLARQGLEVHVAPYDFRAPALASRYIAARRFLPYYIGDGSEWLAAITALLTREGYDLVIPCDERALMPLHGHRETLNALTRLAIPDAEGIRLFFDKHETRELARRLGVSVAAGRLITADETVGSIVAETSLPLVVKPRQSYTLSGLHARGKVRVVTDTGTLAEILPSVTDGHHIYEAFFPGEAVGVSVLASNGKLLQTFQHRRAHELDGSGYYRVGTPLTASLVEAVGKMTAATAYTGIAMFEFKLNTESGDWVLLEINARPWGSMPLPVGLGIDFPYFWYQLLVQGIEAPARSYRSGVYARNFLPDFWQSVAEAQALRSHPGRMLRFLAGRAAEYGRALTGREFHDVFTFSDPRPGLVEIGGLLQRFWQRFAARLPGAAERRRQRDYAAVREAVRRKAGAPLRVSVVCQGNICRSPFAALALQRLSPGVQVTSAGMLPRAGAPSPAVAIEAAAERGIDLRTHASAHFAQGLAEQSDIVLIFDEKNEHWLRNRYPGLAAPPVFFGSFAKTEGVEIDDPDGHDLRTFRETYARIETACRELAALLSGGGYAGGSGAVSGRSSTGKTLLPPAQTLTLPSGTAPVLTVVIDTEEEFDWSAPFNPQSTGTRNIAEQGLAQAIFDRYGIVPTYVIDYPVAQSAEGQAVLRPIAERGGCEIGAHLHPWVNPPQDEAVNAFHSFPGNLPDGLEERKLDVLAGCIEATFGRRPVIYKAGRYGVGPATDGILKTLGFTIDVSVVPHTDFSAAQGPDFSAYDNGFYRTAGGITELPLSVHFVGHLAAWGPRLFPLLSGGLARTLRLPGIFARLGLLERLRLSPEGHSLTDLIRQTRAALAAGQRSFMLTYHSSSLLPGAAPYVHTEADRQAFLATLDGYFAFFMGECGGRPSSVSGLAESLTPGR